MQSDAVPDFIVRHVSFLDLTLPLKQATLAWLERDKTSPAAILADEAICGAGFFLFDTCTGELVNEATLTATLADAGARIGIARKLSASLGTVERPMALRFQAVDDMSGGQQFIVLPINRDRRSLHLLRFADW